MLLTQSHSDKTVTIKPIETRAYGHRFRSRLEARWAVFFTKLRMRWEYEPEGFVIDGEPYLPDFRVWTPQGMPIWYEIKPAHVPTDEKLEKFSLALEEATDLDSGIRTALLHGSPLDYANTHHPCPRCGFLLPSEDFYDCGDEMGASCFHCDMETPSGGGNPLEFDGLWGVSYHPNKGFVMTTQGDFQFFSDRMHDAATSAASARFEHGETP